MLVHHSPTKEYPIEIALCRLSKFVKCLVNTEWKLCYDVASHFKVVCFVGNCGELY